MKKITQLALASSAALFMLSCSDAASNKAESESTQSVAADGHQHTYSCPMHPEVTGKEGDACSKCGMKLEHNDAVPAAAGTYFMQFVAMPSTVEPNKEVSLSFTPKKKEAEGEQVALDVQHEKKIHLILVSDDLSWFDHIHPEYNADGSYTVKTTFPAPGKYKAFADFKPTGSNPIVEKIDINVVGSAPAVKAFSTKKTAGISGNYSFELVPTGGKFITGVPLHITGIVKKDGKEIDANSLENYLGAKAHFVLISLNEKEYLHVHPEVAEGKFDLHTTIEKPGTYRGWVQFNGDGKLHTIDFTLKVAQGSADDAQKAAAGHGTSKTEDHSNHSH